MKTILCNCVESIHPLMQLGHEIKHFQTTKYLNMDSFPANLVLNQEGCPWYLKMVIGLHQLLRLLIPLRSRLSFDLTNLLWLQCHHQMEQFAAKLNLANMKNREIHMHH